MDTHFIPGASLEAEVVYFPGGFPLRALVKKQVTTPGADPILPGYPNLGAAHQAYTAALTANPWLDLFPMTLNCVLPFQAGENWGLQDAEGRFLPLAPGFSQAWALAALSGGGPIDVFCEWNGATLWPLSACAEGRFVRLHAVKAQESNMSDVESAWQELLTAALLGTERARRRWAAGSGALPDILRPA